MSHTLTNRQLEVAERMQEGLTADEIALEIGCTRSTVTTHVHGIAKRLNMVGAGRIRVLLRLQELGELVRPTPVPGAEGPLAPGWKAYLRAFDRLTKAPEKKARRAAAEMKLMREAACIDTRHPRLKPRRGNREMGLARLMPNLEFYT